MKIYILTKMIFDKVFYYLEKILNNFIKANISQLNFNKILSKYH